MVKGKHQRMDPMSMRTYGDDSDRFKRTSPIELQWSKYWIQEHVSFYSRC